MIDLVEEQFLGLNPAHRGGELPGQQLDEEQAGECLRLKRGGVEAVELARRSHRGHGVDEFLGQLERHCHEVRHVAADQRVEVKLSREELVELLRKRGHAIAQHAGVERDVDARNHHGCAFLDSVGAADQLAQAGLGASHGVLLTADVVVDDF